MNPWLIRFGITAVVVSAAFLINLWASRNNRPQSHHTSSHPGNYDGSSIKMCCICLTEFSLMNSRDVISLPCRHKVCRECCRKMFSHQVRNNRTCPQCRVIVPEEFVSKIL